MWGASAGGHLVALLGMTGHVRALEVGPNKEHSSRVQAVCDFFGPTDFLKMDAQGGLGHDALDSPESTLLGGPVQNKPAEAARANPLTHLVTSEARQIPPFLIVHGDNDETVPAAQSVLLHEALTAKKTETELVRLPGAGHGGPAFESPEMQAKIAAFFDKHLRPKAAFAAVVADDPRILGNTVFERNNRKNLIFEDGFESGGWRALTNSGSTAGTVATAPPWYQSMNQGDYSAKAVTTPAPREGKYSVRFEWQAANYEKGSNTSKKATLLTAKEPTCREERWWGFSMYLPSKGMEKDSKPEILVQWHSTPDKGEAWTNPPLSFSNSNDQLSVSWIYDTRALTPDGWRDWDRKGARLGPTPKDRWVDLVFHIKWDPWGQGPAGGVDGWQKGRGPARHRHRLQRSGGQLHGHRPVQVRGNERPCRARRLLRRGPRRQQGGDLRRRCPRGKD